MDTNIDARITPSLHPDTVRAVDGYNESTAVFVSDVVSAFNDAYVTIAKLHDASEAGAANPSWTPEKRYLFVSKEAAKHQERLLRKMDAASTNLGKSIASIEGELSQPLKERAGLGNLNGEVRAYARGLKHAERTGLINDAFAADDVDTLQAILGAQPFLSGLAAAEHEMYVQRLREKQHPDLVARLRIMRAGLAKLDRDAGKVIVEVQKAIGADPKRVNSIIAANERALAALRIEPSA